MKELTIEQLIPGNKQYDEMQPERLSQVQDCGGLMFCIERHMLKLYDQTTCVCCWPLSEMEESSGICFDENLQWNSTGERGVVWCINNNMLFVIDVVNKKIVEKTSIVNCQIIDYSKEAKSWTYTKDNGLYILTRDKRHIAVEKPDDNNIIVGKPAARNEFGIDKGAFWSKDGKKLAYYVVDNNGVTRYPIVHIESPIAKVREIFYPMAGCKSENAKLHIFDLEKNTIVELEKQGTEEDYICCVTFGNDSQLIYASELRRDQQHHNLNVYDANTGKHIDTILSEDDEKYVEPQHAPLFIDGTELMIWQSRKNGFNHLYLYDLADKTEKQLTKGEWEVTNLAGWDKNGECLIFECNASDVRDRDIMKVTLDGEMTKLSMESGTHNATLLNNGYYVDQFSSGQVPYIALLKHTTDMYNIRPMMMSGNPLEGYKKPIVKMGKIVLNDDEICYRIVAPSDCSAEKKYPMICYFYGGPHVQLITNNWNNGTSGFEYLMAQSGYVVFSIDPHGSDNRGKEFEQKIWRNISKPQVDDYVKAIEWMTDTYKFIDKERIGVYGWSFGGHISTRLKIEHPELFKVAIAGGAVTNWNLYEVMYTERYMQTPQKNQQGYKETNLIEKASGLTEKMMMIHCDEDEVVLWQNTLEMQKSAMKAGKHMDYSVYIGFPHNVRGQHRVHLMEKIKEYFEANL